MRQNSETGASDTAARRNGWAVFDLEEFTREGLLAHINAEFFWPLGLALTIVAERTGPGDRDFDWPHARLRMTTTDPPEPIEAGREDHAELRARAREWIERRRDVLDG